MKALIPLNQTFNGIHLRFKHGIWFWYVLFLRYSKNQTVQIFLIVHTFKHRTYNHSNYLSCFAVF